MKKFFVILAIAFSCSFAAQAQIYVGGTVGFSYSHFKLSKEDKAGAASFKLLPEVGYQFSDKFGAGMTIGYVKGLSAMGSYDPTDMKGFLTSVVGVGSEFLTTDLGLSTGIGAFRWAPYFRYIFYRTGKIELFVDAVVGMNFGSIVDKSEEEIDKQGFNAFEVLARPGISVSLNDHFKLIAKLGGLGFQTAGMSDTVQRLSRFGLDADPCNLMFGLVYNFTIR